MPLSSMSEKMARHSLEISMLLSMMIGLFLASTFWGYIDHQVLIFWLAALVGMTLLRVVLLEVPSRFQHNEVLEWWTALISGSIWGSSSFLFLSYLPIEQEMLLILAQIGMVAGSSSFYTGKRARYFAFILPVLIPLTIWLLVQQSYIYFLLGIVTLSYTLYLLFYTKDFSRVFQETEALNAQLLSEVEWRKNYEERLEVNQDILDTIARHRGALEPLLHKLIVSIEATFPDMMVSVLLLDQEGKHLLTGAAPSLPKVWNDAVHGVEVGEGVGSCGTAIYRKQRVIVSDIATDPLWENYRDVALPLGLKACWSELIMGSERNLLGTFAIYYGEPQKPTEEALQWMAYLASLTSLAIENTRSRQDMEVMLQEKAELNQIIEHTSDLIFTLDTDGQFVACNDAAKTHFGDALIGQHLSSILPPDQLLLAENMKHQKLKDGGATIYEIDAVDKLGNRCHLEVNSSLKLRNGEVCGINGIARDMSERKRAEKAIELRMQAIHASREPIMVLDAQGVIEFANPAAAELYQLRCEEMEGKTAAELRGGFVGDDLYQTIIGTLQQGETWAGDIVLARADEKARIVERRISPIRDEAGVIRHQVCIDRDITEVKKRTQQMEHTQRLESLGVLAGGIAHDFNNILTVIMANAAILERSEQSEKVRTCMGRIRQGSEKAADLCRQMLAYSGQGQLNVRPLVLSDLLEEIARLMEISIGKQVELLFDLDAHLPSIMADQAQMQQVILNLITNANEAIGQQWGQIRFSTGVMQASRDYLAASSLHPVLEAGEYVYLEVADTGCGMDGETQAKIFDPFFTTKFTGRGLGMSAMLGIVRSHHGSIHVESEEGHGTTIRVLFPACDCALDSDALDAPTLPSTSLIKGEYRGVILVVDDEEGVREVASAILEDMGFETLEAEDGLQAVAIYRQKSADIQAVLLDMTMPKMGGKACFLELLHINPAVRVMISSGYHENQLHDMFDGQEPAGFVQKPYLPEVLESKLSDLLR